MGTDAKVARTDVEDAATDVADAAAHGEGAGDIGVHEIRDLMWTHVGLFRTGDGVQTAVAALDAPWGSVTRRIRGGARLDSDEWKRANLLTVARLIARAALRRTETRGGHFRADFPDRDDIHFHKHFADVRRL